MNGILALLSFSEWWTHEPHQGSLWIDNPPWLPGFRFGPWELGLLLLTLYIVFISSRPRRKEGAHLSRRAGSPAAVHAEEVARGGEEPGSLPRE